MGTKRNSSEVGRRRSNVQVHPPLLSITSPNPLSNLLHIFTSSSFSQVSGTHNSSFSVISSGKVNVGKRVRKWVLVERELCWPPEMDSRKFCHLAFLLLLPPLIVRDRKKLTSMTVAAIPHPLSSPSTHPAFRVSAVIPLPKSHPHSSPQVSPVLFRELTKNFSGIGIPFPNSLCNAEATSKASEMPEGARLASCGVGTFLAFLLVVLCESS
jgi:hypothetical protein